MHIATLSLQRASNHSTCAVFQDFLLSLSRAKNVAFLFLETRENLLCNRREFFTMINRIVPVQRVA